TTSTVRDYTNHYVDHLLTFTDKKFKVASIDKGDIVVVLDRIKQKFHDPDNSAIGRVLEVSKGQRQFSVQMVRPPDKCSPLERYKKPEKPLSRPRRSLVLLLRADENLKSPVWVDPWMNLSRDDIIKPKYKPLRVKFQNHLPKVPDIPTAPSPLVSDQNTTNKLTIEHAEPVEMIQDLATLNKTSTTKPIISRNDRRTYSRKAARQNPPQ
ncbi:MAG: hypothetical protein GY830_11450, partial [Bacteroidetes bacterium]|nr:hypothetical protein [Bacteroidota bacterium]